MHKKVFLSLTILYFILTGYSCRSKNPDSKKSMVIVYHYDRAGNARGLKSIDTIFMSRKMSKDTINFRYYPFPGLVQKFKDSIIYDKISCPLLFSKTVKWRNKNYIINSYWYDKATDAEAEITLNDSFGLMQIHSVVWGHFDLFNTSSFADSINRQLLKYNTDNFLMTIKNSRKHEAILDSVLFEKKLTNENPFKKY